MSCVLITGADGFVGKALCEEMISRGLKVRASMRSGDKIKNLPEEIEFIETGLIDADTNWKKALADVESVIHLAGRVHLMDDSSSNLLSKYRIANTAGTVKLARSAASSGVRRFVFMSTVKVNGEGRAGSYVEDDLPDPKDPYGISKWEAEEKLKEISRETGMEAVIIRAPMVYGPRVKANFLRLLKAVDRGIPMPLAGINNRRSMIYLGNLVDVIIECLTHADAGQKTYLASDGNAISTPELIKQIAAALGKPERLFYMPLFILRLAGVITGKSQEIERLTGSLTVDSSLLKKELNWTPPFTSTMGLEKTAEWYKKTFGKR